MTSSEVECVFLVLYFIIHTCNHESWDCLKISSDVSMVETERARFKHVQQCMVPALEARKDLTGSGNSPPIHTPKQSSVQVRKLKENSVA